MICVLYDHYNISIINFQSKKIINSSQIFSSQICEVAGLVISHNRTYQNLAKSWKREVKSFGFPFIKWQLVGAYCVNMVILDLFVLAMWQCLGLKFYWTFWSFYIFVILLHPCYIFWQMSFHLSHIFPSPSIFPIWLCHEMFCPL